MKRIILRLSSISILGIFTTVVVFALLSITTNFNEYQEHKSFASILLQSTDGFSLGSSHKNSEKVESYIFRVVHNSAIPKHLTYIVTKTIMNESHKHGLDPMFTLALIMHESGMRPNRRGAHGEYGLMQILPNTAMSMAKKIGIDIQDESELFSPVLNIQIGVAYFAKLHNKYQNVQLAASAYNMGARNVQKLLNKKIVPSEYFNNVSNKYREHFAGLYGLQVAQGRTIASL